MWNLYPSSRKSLFTKRRLVAGEECFSISMGGCSLLFGL
jgi:hypothetical protein